MQKSIFISVTLILFVCAANAQTEKGSWVAGASIGSAGFSKSLSNTAYSYSPDESNGESRSFSFNVAPFGMYFIKDNLAIGPLISLSFSKSKGESSSGNSLNIWNDKSHSNSISVGPQIRKYFGEPGSKGQPWVEAFGAISATTSRSESINTMSQNKSESAANSTGWNAGLGIGYSHFLNRYLAMQYYMNFRRSHSTREVDQVSTQNMPYSYEINVDNNSVGFGVGIAIHLPSKK